MVLGTGDSGSGYLANLEPRAKKYYALGLHKGKASVVVMKKSAFDAIWPNQMFHVFGDDLDNLVIPRTTSLLQLPGSPAPVVIATIQAQGRSVDVEVYVNCVFFSVDCSSEGILKNTLTRMCA